jgi:hypothetical protein
MNNQNKILYEHLKDYPISTEGFHDIGNRAVAAALYSEHMPHVPEASPEKSPQSAVPDSSE